MLSLQGKNAVITGATSGIGAEILKLFTKLGAKCVASGTNEQKLAEISANYPNVLAKKCNIKNPTEIAELLDEATKFLGNIDIIVCNAGITKDGLLMQMKEEAWDDVIDTNLKSSFLLAKGVIRQMLKQKSGRIIFISSVVGFTGNPGQTNYVASKSALTGMAKAIAKEVGSRGITVNCVAPGFIATPMTHALNDEQAEKINQQIPLGKMGEPQDIANAVAFLASDMASYITGETIHVNGGMF